MTKHVSTYYLGTNIKKLFTYSSCVWEEKYFQQGLFLFCCSGDHCGLCLF